MKAIAMIAAEIGSAKSDLCFQGRGKSSIIGWMCAEPMRCNIKIPNTKKTLESTFYKFVIR